MLNKRYRFHSRGGVKYVYKHGKTIWSSGMSVVFVQNTRGFTRIAVVVSKKVIKSAVGRNRIRRRVYEAVRLNMDVIPKKMDYIFVVHTKDVMTMKFDRLEGVIRKMVSESKVCYNRENG